MRLSSGIPLLAGLLLAVGPSFAGPIGTFNEVIAFGDSLSDSGNASIATLGIEPATRGSGYYYRSVPGVPFQVGEFTNAPTPGGPTGVWVDQLAGKLGLPVAQPALAGGTNFAVADAVTGSAGVDNIDAQLALFGTKAPSNALYTIWGGANDIFNLATHPANPVSTGVTAADNLYNNVLKLSAEGARYFLWANLPNLGLTPAALASTPADQAGATAASNAFNAEFAVDLMKLQAGGIAVVGLDVASLFNQIVSDPGAYGFTNVTGSAIVAAQSPDVNIDSYLFWDDVHPTAAADALLADAAYSDLTAASAPEPAAFALAGIGFAGLLAAAVRRRRKQQS